MVLDFQLSKLWGKCRSHSVYTTDSIHKKHRRADLLLILVVIKSQGLTWGNLNQVRCQPNSHVWWKTYQCLARWKACWWIGLCISGRLIHVTSSEPVWAVPCVKHFDNWSGCGTASKEQGHNLETAKCGRHWGGAFRSQLPGTSTLHHSSLYSNTEALQQWLRTVAMDTYSSWETI